MGPLALTGVKLWPNSRLFWCFSPASAGPRCLGRRGSSSPQAWSRASRFLRAQCRPSNTHLIRGRRKAQNRGEPSSEARPEGITHTGNVFLSENNGAQNNSESEWAGPQPESPAPPGRCRAGCRPSTAAGPFRWNVGRGRSQSRTQAARCAPAAEWPPLNYSPPERLGNTKREPKDLNSRRERRPEAAKAEINHVIKTGRGRGPKLGVPGSEEGAKVQAEAGERLRDVARPPGTERSEGLRGSL